MTTEEERKDLREFPLPVESMDFTACSSDRVLQNIAYLQEQIYAEKTHLNYLVAQLDKLKGRAISESIGESGKYYLVEIPGKRMRNPIRDIDRFREAFPEGYKRIRIQQTVELQDQILNIDSTGIPLGLADRNVGEEQVTLFTGYQPQKINVEVRMKMERLR